MGVAKDSVSVFDDLMMAKVRTLIVWLGYTRLVAKLLF